MYRNLRSNHSTRAPGLVCFLDSETTPHPIAGRHNAVIHKLRLGIARVRVTRSGKAPTEDEILFRNPCSLWTWIASHLDRHRPLWLFAHNLGFDLTVTHFWDALEAGEFTLMDPRDESDRPQRRGKPGRPWKGKAVLDDPPTILKVRHHSGPVLTMIDTLNYWRCSLAKLGDDFGLPKLEMPAFERPDEEWAVYCRNDVDIIDKAVTSLMEWTAEGDLGVFQPTAPSLAYHAYRHRFMPHKVTFCDDPKSRALERACYFGGRCEARWIGKVGDHPSKWEHPTFARLGAKTPQIQGPVYHLDIAGTYPSVMRDNLYPTKLRTVLEDVDCDTLKHAQQLHAVCALVLIDDGDNCYTVRRGKSSFQARGRYWTALCGPELGRALASRSVVECPLASLYDQADLFTEYVDYFWTERLKARAEGHFAHEALCKLFLNSLYGKFGQRGAGWIDENHKGSPVPWGHYFQVSAQGHQRTVRRSIGWWSQRKGEESEISEAFPAICAHVTARVREKLDALICVAGERNVLYCDTDSLHCTEAGFTRLMLANVVKGYQLGALRLVEKEMHAEYRAQRDYTIGTRRRVAGVKSHAKETDPGTYRQEHFGGLATLLAGQPPEGVPVVTGSTTFHYNLRGRVLNPDGWTEPIALDDPDMPAEYAELLGLP